MTRAAVRSRVSVAEYLAWEREQPTRHEYFDGEIFAMAGGSMRHNALCVRMSTALAIAPEHQGCVTLSSDQRIGLGDRKYVYADVAVVCEAIEADPHADDVLTNPGAIVEVLSSSTEQYDRGAKWEGYRRIASLRDYLLVSQRKPQMELYQRTSADTWSYRAFGPGEHPTLTSGAAIDLDGVFDGLMALPGDDDALE
jgi:Uma2 family endonuclease